ncbi:MAG TPA: adenylate/guanylate cyclase domain-containing protein, partial [Limnobacter sp.]|nr:adenylate/guanylate cyclase domain-containing protein [Limnobacter sp.]
VKGMLFQELDAVRVKGKNEPVSIFAPVCEKAGATDAIQAELAHWQRFLALFRQQEFDAALQVLNDLADQAQSHVLNPTLTELYQARIEYFRTQPPGEGWDGVTTFDTK